MNLANNPTREELAAMMTVCDDAEASHIIWVEHNGIVHIDPLPDDISANGFQRRHEKAMRFCLETCSRGNGYVGEEAAKDDRSVDEKFCLLVEHWKENTTGYVDY
jgi:hypothetical protein